MCLSYHELKTVFNFLLKQLLEEELSKALPMVAADKGSTNQDAGVHHFLPSSDESKRFCVKVNDTNPM